MSYKIKFKLPDFSKREKFLFFSAIVLFLSALAILLVRFSLINVIGEVNRQIDEKELILIRYSASNMDYTSFSQGKKSRQSLELEVIEKVRELSRGHNLVVQSIKPLEAKSKKYRHKELTFKVVVDGSLASLAQFLNKIESWSPAVSLEALVVSSQSSAKAEGLRCKFIVKRVYF